MKKNTNMMACGCAVIIMEQDGKMVTSVDQLFSFIKEVSARSGHRQASKRAATIRA